MADRLTQVSVVFRGWLHKRGNVRKNWKKRMFVLTDDKKLSYYQDESLRDKKGEVDLSQVLSFGPAEGTEKGHMFQVVCPDRTWVFSAEDRPTLEQWLELLDKIVVGMKIFSGWLQKRGHVRKNWKRRFFVVRNNREVRYYEDESCASCLGRIDLTDVVRLEPDHERFGGQPWGITMMTRDRTWYFSAESEQQRERWIHVFELAIGGAKRLITTYEGFLVKRGARVKSWRNRYFVLSRGWIFYFASQGDCQKFKDIAFFSERMFNDAFAKYVRGSVPLEDAVIATVGEFDGRDNVFSVMTPKIVARSCKTFYISAADEEEMKGWIAAILQASSSVTMANNDRLAELQLLSSAPGEDTTEDVDNTTVPDEADEDDIVVQPGIAVTADKNENESAEIAALTEGQEKRRASLSRRVDVPKTDEEDEDNIGDDVPDEEDENARFRRIASTCGGAFNKYGLKAQPRPKTVTIDFDTGVLSWGSGQLKLSEIAYVAEGFATDLFKRIHELAGFREEHCWSVITTQNRTLDLVAESEDVRDFWVRGLRRVVGL